MLGCAPKGCWVLNRASLIRFAKVFYGSAHAFFRGGTAAGSVAGCSLFGRPYSATRASCCEWVFLPLSCRSQASDGGNIGFVVPNRWKIRYDLPRRRFGSGG